MCTTVESTDHSIAERIPYLQPCTFHSPTSLVFCRWNGAEGCTRSEILPQRLPIAIPAVSVYPVSGFYSDGYEKTLYEGERGGGGSEQHLLEGEPVHVRHLHKLRRLPRRHSAASCAGGSLTRAPIPLIPTLWHIPRGGSNSYAAPPPCGSYTRGAPTPYDYYHLHDRDMKHTPSHVTHARP